MKFWKKIKITLSGYLLLASFVLILFSFQVFSQSTENNEQATQTPAKTNYFEIGIKRQTFTYQPADIDQDYLFYIRHTSIKNNKGYTYVPSLQYFNYKYNFRVELSTFSFDRPNMFYDYTTPTSIQSRAYAPMKHSESKLNLMKTIDLDRVEIFLGAGLRQIQKDRRNDFTFSSYDLNQNTAGAQIVAKIQFRITPFLFLRAGYEMFHTQGNLGYSYRTTTGDRGYSISSNPISTFDGNEFEISGLIKFHDNLFLTLGFTEIHAKNKWKNFIPFYTSNQNGSTTGGIDYTLRGIYTSGKEDLHGVNFGLSARF